MVVDAMDEQEAVQTIDLRPNPGPQEAYFSTEADICIYGGGAGSGKSWAIIADPVRYVDLPKFRGAIFRRTSPQLTGQGGLWDECQELYRGMGADLREQPNMDATFPSGASVKFCHLQHEKDKYSHQGLQYAFIGFDEVAQFTEGQFFYLVGRMRTTCGIRPYFRGTCNPEPGWLANFLAWWIDQETGFPIPERSGVLRYFYRDKEDALHWAGSKDELREEFPNVDDYEIMSVTFIPALLDDNPVLLAKDPGYRARLNALPRIERERLLGGNWKTSEGSQISRDWLRRYVANQAEFHFTFQDHFYKIPIAKCRRIATIDTAGTSKEKAAAQKGKEPSWSVCAVWDSLPSISLAIDGRSVVLSELLFLRYVWRKRVDWSRLVEGVDETLETWNVTKAYIENAHHGSALAKQLRSSPCELIGPIIAGMGDRSEGAKLERAIASGMLARWEHGKVFVPTDPSDWLQAYLAEIFGWQGKPDEPADQIDVTSYAAYISKRSSGAWGGVIKKG